MRNWERTGTGYFFIERSIRRVLGGAFQGRKLVPIVQAVQSLRSVQVVADTGFKRERFKSFPVQHVGYLITVWRYVLQNPVRAGLSETVHEWPWSSARRRQLADRSPVHEEIRWSEQLENRLGELPLATIREYLNRQRPFCQSEWQTEMAAAFGLGSTLPPRGRPRTEKKSSLSPF